MRRLRPGQVEARMNGISFCQYADYLSQAQVALPKMERRVGKSAFATKPGNRLAALDPIIELTPPE